MKKLISAVAVTVVVLALCFSGCSDFGFNPIGRWNLTEDRIYYGDKLDTVITHKDDPMMKNLALVFEKSGTGYRDSGTKNKTGFTYDYDDSKVTVYYQLDNKKVVCSVSKDQKSIIVTDVYSDGRVEHVYTRN